MIDETINQKLDKLNPVSCQICGTRLYRASNSKLTCTNEQCKHQNLGSESKVIARYRSSERLSA